jgi:hypothetical protein
VAVNNVLKFVNQMQTLPAYITSQEGGEGFAEFASHILKYRHKVKSIEQIVNGER